MTLTKKAKEEIKTKLVIAHHISPEYLTKKIKELHELQKLLFDLTAAEYKDIDKELNDIILTALDEIEKEQKTA